MEIIVVTVNAYGSTRSNTQIMLRVVSLEEGLFDVPRGGNILVTQENEPLFSSTLACVSFVNSVGPSVLQRISWLASPKVHSAVAVAFKPAGPGSPPPAWQKFRGIGTGACGDRRRRSCCLGSLRAHSLWIP